MEDALVALLGAARVRGVRARGARCPIEVATIGAAVAGWAVAESMLCVPIAAGIVIDSLAIGRRAVLARACGARGGILVAPMLARLLVAAFAAHRYGVVAVGVVDPLVAVRGLTGLRCGDDRQEHEQQGDGEGSHAGI